MSVNFSLGNAMLNTHEFKNLDGSVSGSALKVAYDFGYTDFSFLRLDIGIDVRASTFNLFSNGNQSNLYAEYIRVPLTYYGVFRLGRDESNIFSNTKYFGGAGAFLQYVYKYEVSTIESETKGESVDLDFGFLFTLGLEQDVSTKFSVIMGLENSYMGGKNVSDKLKFNNMAFYIGSRYRF